jgi:hypothetical protein
MSQGINSDEIKSGKLSEITEYTTESKMSRVDAN